MMNMLRRLQVSSDGGRGGGGVSGRGRGQASVERVAASRINITARRSVLPSCLILLLLLSLPAFCFRYLPTLQLLSPDSPFLFLFIFLLHYVSVDPNSQSGTKRTRTTTKKSQSCGRISSSFLTTPFLNEFLPTFQH